ncbi:unnamed protein product, partial [Prorocentrum cordatum]
RPPHGRLRPGRRAGSGGSRWTRTTGTRSRIRWRLPGDWREPISQREDSLDLGADFWGAEVHFRPRLVQKTTKGTRDVGRVELGSADATVAVFVVKHADPKVGWRSAEEGAEGAERRTLREADVMPNALSLSSVPL